MEGRGKMKSIENTVYPKELQSGFILTLIPPHSDMLLFRTAKKLNSFLSFCIPETTAARQAVYRALLKSESVPGNKGSV